MTSLISRIGKNILLPLKLSKSKRRCSINCLAKTGPTPERGDWSRTLQRIDEVERLFLCRLYDFDLNLRLPLFDHVNFLCRPTRYLDDLGL